MYIKNFLIVIYKKAAVVKNIKLLSNINCRRQYPTAELVAAQALLNLGSRGIVASGRAELTGRTGQDRLAGPGGQQYDDAWMSRSAVGVDIDRMIARMYHSW